MKITKKTFNPLAIFITTLFVTSTFVSISNVFGINEFYSQNSILFYEPGETGCISNPSSNTFTSPNSKDNQETVAKFLTSTNFAGNSNKPMNAVQMAAVMGNIQQESGFNQNAVGSKELYRGIIQWSSPGRWDQITDPKTDLISQLNFIKTEMDGSYKNALDEFWSASAPEDLSKATYAITRNYEVAVYKTTTKESTSWTNDADAAKNVQEWANRRDYAKPFYDKYGNLAQSGSGNVPGASCGSLTSGGMTLEEANAFMDEYKNLKPSDWPKSTNGTIYDINGTNCSGGSLANCVAFSQYFVNRYTTKKLTSPRDGRFTASQLVALGFADGGHTPKLYSVFSRSNGEFGHTGVVLAIDTANNKIIIGEASCGSSLDKAGAKEYSLSEFSGNQYTYAYSDGLLKGGGL